MAETLSLDAVIFGGGAAGLWLLDEMARAGYQALLLEAGELGSGQTIASQGILHGGLKYTLGGLFTPAAKAVSDMPLIWRRCLAGELFPNLSNTRLRSEFCHLWQTDSLKSRLAMIGARAGLRVAPVRLDEQQRPHVLASCPGTVARLDEQVIEPVSFLADLREQCRSRLLKIDARHGLEFETNSSGGVSLVRLINPENGEPLDLKPAAVILTAGEGNQRLRECAGLDGSTMQRRPLHMVMARGNLPVLNAHCVDGSATRLTITTTRDSQDRAIWQIGGQISERGVEQDPQPLCQLAQSEIRQTLPRVDLDGVEWATYRVDRAEPRTRSGLRPEEPFADRVGNVVTAWPTKLVLVPELAKRVMALLEPPDTRSNETLATALRWPQPIVALPPWEAATTWTTDL